MENAPPPWRSVAQAWPLFAHRHRLQLIHIASRAGKPPARERPPLHGQRCRARLQHWPLYIVHSSRKALCTSLLRR